MDRESSGGSGAGGGGGGGGNFLVWPKRKRATEQGFVFRVLGLRERVQQGDFRTAALKRV